MRISFTAACLLATALLADAQTPPASTAERIAFDRPESWALEYFAAVTTFTPLAPPRTRAPGELEAGLELGWIPNLSLRQRRVGFEGTALEDLNKTPILARPRVALGLPGGITAEVGWVPPVEIHGERSNLLAAALERPFLEAGPVTLALRVSGQLGHAKGDITCSKKDASHPAGSEGNPLGCDAPSEDTATLNEAGGALVAGFRFPHGALHLAAGATYNDLEFTVGAYLNGEPDNTRLVTHGWTGWAAAGAGLSLGERGWLGAEAFYSPLSVRRPPRTEAENEGLFNVRMLLRVRLN